jgi:hypothetical protein
MMATDAEAALFSVKCFAAALVSYYLSLRIGFSQPVWASSDRPRDSWYRPEVSCRLGKIVLPGPEEIPGIEPRAGRAWQVPPAGGLGSGGCLHRRTNQPSHRDLR